MAVYQLPIVDDYMIIGHTYCITTTHQTVKNIHTKLMVWIWNINWSTIGVYELVHKPSLWLGYHQLMTVHWLSIVDYGLGHASQALYKYYAPNNDKCTYKTIGLDIKY